MLQYGGIEMLRLDHLTKRYGEKTAVDDLSLKVSPGEICAFIGHNGAGKTTTLKCICGILPFEGGEIYVDGVSVKDDPMEVKRRIAYLPDNPDLYEFLTGDEFLNFISDVFGLSKEVRQESIGRYAAVFGVSDVLADKISSYSHGMKQKLAVVSALIHAPRLLILDEPFVGLDPVSAKALKDIMRELCSEGGAVFFSTHVLEVAEKLCDKVVIIKNGKLVISGEMDEVKGNDSLEDVFLELEGTAE